MTLLSHPLPGPPFELSAGPPLGGGTWLRLLLGLLILLVAGPALAQAQITVLASVDSAGNQGNAQSLGPSMSADGRLVVFRSLATNLTPDCPGGGIFRRDLMTQTTTCLVSTLGASSISADGRFVAFWSTSLTLDPNCATFTFTGQVFVRDMDTGTIICVSVAGPNGPAATGGASNPSISGDGRFIAFATLATNLGSCTSPGGNVFVHDRVMRTTRCASVAADGTTVDNSNAFQRPGGPVISRDGRFVAFTSAATNLDATASRPRPAPRRCSSRTSRPRPSPARPTWRAAAAPG